VYKGSFIVLIYFISWGSK